MDINSILDTLFQNPGYNSETINLSLFVPNYIFLFNVKHIIATNVRENYIYCIKCMIIWHLD